MNSYNHRRAQSQVFINYHNPLEELTKVCVVGHSIIRNLREYMLSAPQLTLDFGIEGVTSSFLCRGGWHISDIRQNCHYLQRDAPRVVFLQVAGNDIPPLTNGFNNVLTLAESTIQLAVQIRSQTQAKSVWIGRLLNRGINARYLPSEDHVLDYNRKVNMVNTYIEGNVYEHPGVHFYKSRGAHNPIFLAEDGTHLNELGLKNYYRQVRGALLHAVNHTI